MATEPSHWQSFKLPTNEFGKLTLEGMQAFMHATRKLVPLSATALSAKNEAGRGRGSAQDHRGLRATRRMAERLHAEMAKRAIAIADATQRWEN
jgi:hypothetical protein